MSIMTADFSDSNVWGLKYRPQTIQECILPKQVKAQFQEMINSGKVPNLLLASPIPGIGKTTSAMAIARELNADVLFLNASLNNSIDDVRTTILNFCSTVSLEDNPKIVLMDESDQITQSAQLALRGIFEQFSGVTFILTCNYAQKIAEPIRSRCSTINFEVPEEERKDILKQFLIRIFGILDKEGVKYDRKVVVEFVNKHFPDFRKVLNELQRFAIGGDIDVSILNAVLDTKLDELVGYIKNRDFTSVRKWIGENNIDFTTFYGKLYDDMYEFLEPSSIPETVLTLAKYQHMSATVADHQLNCAACMIELMSCTSFR